MLEAQSTTKDYIRAEGDFHKKERKKDTKLNGLIGQKEDRRNRVRKRKVVGIIYGMKYS